MDKYDINELSYLFGTLLYSGTWELGSPKGLSKTVVNSEVVLLFLRAISM